MNLDLESKKVRQLGKNEQIPYDLLLLADESMEAINKYIHDSDIYILEIENKILVLRDAANKAKEQGFKTMLIGTSNASFKQLYIYQKSGFEIYDIKENFIINNYPKPIYENGLLLKHMIMLRKTIA
ncbi:MAG: GNAT family N-acetyltransferase [candidate division WOR-3 bacterium]